MKYKKINIALISLLFSNFTYSSNGFVAVIMPAENFSYEDSVSPYGWYDFFEADCLSGSSSSLADLNAWQTGDSIYCNGSSESIANIADLTLLTNGLTIGNTSKYYNTENTISFSNLKTVSNGTMELYLKGEGVSFENLDNKSNVVLHLNDLGLKEISAKGVKNFQFQVIGDSVNLSPVNTLTLDNAMYGYSYSPVLVNFIKNTDIITTPDSTDSMAYINDSNLKDITLTKSATLDTLTDGAENYIHYRFLNSSLDNLTINNADDIYLSHDYSKTKTEVDSFYDINNININNTSISYASLADFNNINRVNLHNVKVSSLRMEDGKDITDGIYITNDKNDTFGDGNYISITQFDNIGTLSISDVFMKDSGSVTFEVRNNINNVEYKNTIFNYNTIKANSIENMSFTIDDSAYVEFKNSNLTIDATVKNLTFDQKYLPYLSLKETENLIFNNIKSNKDTIVMLHENVNDLTINTTNDFEELNISLRKDLSSLSITNNNKATGVIKIIIDDVDLISDINIFKDIDSLSLVLSKSISEGQPFSNKFPNSSSFCINYGTNTFVYDKTETQYSKSEICN